MRIWTPVCSLITLFALCTAVAAQVPTLQYDTWPDVAGSVINTGSSAAPGTLVAPGLTTYPGPGPDDGTLTAPSVAVHFADGGGPSSTGINTNLAYNSLVGGDGSMTMSAWVNLDTGGDSGDHMVFGAIGSAGNQGLHLGFRNGQAYFGFWGNDSAENTTTFPINGWHHFAWVYDPNNGGGNQSIYEDGVLLGTNGGHGAYSHGGNLAIGSHDFGNGSIDGKLDDLRVYNTAFTDAQVANLFQNSSNPDLVPEPSSIVLAGVGLVGLLAAYRRRKA